MKKPVGNKPRLPLGDNDTTPAVRDLTEPTNDKADRQEVFLPVSGFVWFYRNEIKIINHPAFQRLGRINQLGQAFVVYRGATHKRLEHSMGAVSIIQRMATASRHNAAKAANRGFPIGEKLGDDEERFVRLGALLHDIGHIAAGHTLEDELGLLAPHDADARLTKIFKKTDFDPMRPESLEELIDREFSSFIPESLKSDLSATMIVRLLIRKRPERKKDEFAAQQDILEKSSEIRLNVCANMIGNTICADLLDYLFRDWYHVGKPRTFDDRILQYMEVRSTASSQAERKLRSANDRFVIALGKSPKVRTDGVSAILELLEWRYQLAETVLFHRTKLAAAAMLDRALFELWEDSSEDAILNSVLTLSDDQLLDAAYEQSSANYASSSHSRFRIAADNLTRLKHRNLFAELKTWATVDLPELARPKIQALYGARSADRRAAALARTTALRTLESDFGLSPGSLAMYCAEMTPKIAEVSIAVEDDILPFNEYELKHKDRLSGGHLRAQSDRFDSLWRIHFFIERGEKERVRAAGLESALLDAIDVLVLGNTDPELANSRARNIALILANSDESKWKGAEVLGLPALAARGDETRGNRLSYPNGAPSIASFLVKKGEPAD